MAMVMVEMEMEIGAETMVTVDGFFSSSPPFWSRGVSLYRGPFTKVVPFDRSKVVASIWRELYGREKYSRRIVDH